MNQSSNRPNSRFRHLHVVVRLDEFYDEDTPLEHKVSLTKAFWTEEQAENEVVRMNELNQGKGCQYIRLFARLVES